VPETTARARVDGGGATTTTARGLFHARAHGRRSITTQLDQFLSLTPSHAPPQRIQDQTPKARNVQIKGTRNFLSANTAPKTMTGLRRLIPLLDRVLVERVVAPTKSAGGVLLPESAVPKVRFS
jgi:hypothetical protein